VEKDARRGLQKTLKSISGERRRRTGLRDNDRNQWLKRGDEDIAM
jgi:hypothetical protein